MKIIRKNYSIFDDIRKDLIPRARDFALKHHKEIVTTVSGFERPQYLHIQEVADLVFASGGTDEEIAAAWLHDSIEDTTVTKNNIENNFGKKVAKIVQNLTDLDEFKELPLEDRKRKQADRLRCKNKSVCCIKLADQISNVRHLALDPTTTMTLLECKKYIQGANLIASKCKGISPLLDRLFSQVYKRGTARYKSVN